MMHRIFHPLIAFAALVASFGFWGFATAQNPGAGPNVYGAGNYGPPFQAANGHLTFPGAMPSVNAACGTGAAIVGTDAAFVLTSGTSSSNTCQITPGAAYSKAPICILHKNGATQPAYTIGPSGVISLSGVADSITYYVHCIAQPGGL